VFEDKGRSAADQNMRLDDRLTSMVDRLVMVPLGHVETLDERWAAFRPSLAIRSPLAVDRGGDRLQVDG
jgi:hypothetical protein